MLLLLLLYYYHYYYCYYYYFYYYYYYSHYCCCCYYYLHVWQIDVGWKLNAIPNTTTSTHYWHYYTNISQALLRRVLHKYEVDFEMFGYEVPATLKELLR